MGSLAPADAPNIHAETIARSKTINLAAVKGRNNHTGLSWGAAPRGQGALVSCENAHAPAVVTAVVNHFRKHVSPKSSTFYSRLPFHVAANRFVVIREYPFDTPAFAQPTIFTPTLTSRCPLVDTSGSTNLHRW